MCVCVCVCVCVYFLSIHLSSLVFVRTKEHTHTHTHAHTDSNTHTHTHTDTRAHISNINKVIHVTLRIQNLFTNIFQSVDHVRLIHHSDEYNKCRGQLDNNSRHLYLGSNRCREYLIFSASDTFHIPYMKYRQRNINSRTHRQCQM